MRRRSTGCSPTTVADGRDADAWAYDRPPEGYLHARLLDHARGDWATTIVRRYLYDTADEVRLQAVASSSHRPLAELVAKIRREERYHLMHVQTWIERLAGAGGESRARVLAALERLGPDAGTVLAPLPGEAALVRHGIVAEPFADHGAALARWRRRDVPDGSACRSCRRPPRRTAPGPTTRTRSGALHAEFTTVRRSEVGATW